MTYVVYVNQWLILYPDAPALLVPRIGTESIRSISGEDTFNDTTCYTIDTTTAMTSRNITPDVSDTPRHNPLNSCDDFMQVLKNSGVDTEQLRITLESL